LLVSHILPAQFSGLSGSSVSIPRLRALLPLPSVLFANSVSPFREMLHPNTPTFKPSNLPTVPDVTPLESALTLGDGVSPLESALTQTTRGGESPFHKTLRSYLKLRLAAFTFLMRRRFDPEKGISGFLGHFADHGTRIAEPRLSSRITRKHFQARVRISLQMLEGGIPA
jgi:hypothetical protein